MRKFFLYIFAFLLFSSTANAGMVASWLLDEGSGANTWEDSTGSCDLTRYNVVESATDRDSNANYCAVFAVARTGQLKSTTNLTDINFNDTDDYFTVSLWVYPLASSPFGAMPLYAVGTTDQYTNITYGVFLNTDRKIHFYTDFVSGSGNILASATALSINTWHHVVCVYDGSNKYIYINGDTTPDASAEDTTGADGTVNNVWIGNNYVSGAYTHAQVDDVFVFDHAFSTSDVTTWYSTDANSLTTDYISVSDNHDDKRVYQRDLSTLSGRTMTIAGTYAGSPTNIEYRLTDEDSWSTLVSSPTGGSFTADVAVSNGGPYSAQVRFSNDTDMNNTELAEWYVGATFLFAGQSNIYFWSNSGDYWTSLDVTVDSHVKIVERDKNDEEWQDCAYDECVNGAGSFGDTLYDTLEVPIGMLQTGIGSTCLRYEANDILEAGYWWDERTNIPGPFYYDARDLVLANDGEIEGLVWIQGETDAIDQGVTTAEYVDSFERLIARMRSDLNPSLPIVICSIGRWPSMGSDVPAIKTAHYQVIATDADVYSGTDLLTYTLSADTFHFTNAENTTIGELTAKVFLHEVYEEGSCSRGPRILGWTKGATYYDLTCAFDCDSAFASPSSAWTGFTIEGSSVSIDTGTGISNPSAAVIRIPITGDVDNVTAIHYQNSRIADVSDAVYSTNGYPLEFYADIPEYESTLPTCVISTPTASATYSIAGTTDWVTVSGTSSDAGGISAVKVRCPECERVKAVSGDESWSVVLNLSEGSNEITVTAYDEVFNSASDVITVACSKAGIKSNINAAGSNSNKNAGGISAY